MDGWFGNQFGCNFSIFFSYIKRNLNKMLIFYYLINIIENWIDQFFVTISKEAGGIEEFSIEKEMLEIKDILNSSKDMVELFFQIEMYVKNSILFNLGYRLYLSAWLFLFITSDIFLVILSFLWNHLGLTKKIYEDYIHNQWRREMLLIWNMFFVILLFVWIIILFL